jgi:hypothetical protein
MYANDLALLASSQEELQQLLDETQRWAEENFAIINEEKSHVMVFMENQIDRDARISAENTLYVRHEHQPDSACPTLKEVTTFKYLGLTLDYQLDFDTAVKHAIQAFWHSHSQVRMLDVHVHWLHPNLQITLWKQLVLSALNTCLLFIWIPAQANK